MARKKTGRAPQDRINGGLAKAIASKGTLTALAVSLDLTVQAVSQWTQVPTGRCLDVERATGVSRYELRPDIYGSAPKYPARKHAQQAA